MNVLDKLVKGLDKFFEDYDLLKEHVLNNVFDDSTLYLVDDIARNGHSEGSNLIRRAYLGILGIKLEMDGEIRLKLGHPINVRIEGGRVFKKGESVDLNYKLRILARDFSRTYMDTFSLGESPSKNILLFGGEIHELKICANEMKHYFSEHNYKRNVEFLFKEGRVEPGENEGVYNLNLDYFKKRI
ncbi:hypothetical protein COU54_04665 [Candidatus Pacearchaeota archaeon CG10_big_fil_rev_8_21_14_0_10_31_24]|nr:MAG: hypothetical protein COU54_04665 [Candidatus Pacearchaeota archaeon CG10_big_fil_rev_8_21_14_0_10_31_24]